MQFETKSIVHDDNDDDDDDNEEKDDIIDDDYTCNEAHKNKQSCSKKT